MEPCTKARRKQQTNVQMFEKHRTIIIYCWRVRSFPWSHDLNVQLHHKKTTRERRIRTISQSLFPINFKISSIPVFSCLRSALSTARQVLTRAGCISRVLGGPVVASLAVTLHGGGVGGAAVVGTRAARAVPHRVLKLGRRTHCEQGGKQSHTVPVDP